MCSCNKRAFSIPYDAQLEVKKKKEITGQQQQLDMKCAINSAITVQYYIIEQKTSE